MRERRSERKRLEALHAAAVRAAEVNEREWLERRRRVHEVVFGRVTVLLDGEVLFDTARQSDGAPSVQDEA